MKNRESAKAEHCFTCKREGKKNDKKVSHQFCELIRFQPFPVSLGVKWVWGEGGGCKWS